MIPKYEDFMRPMLDQLLELGRASYGDLSRACSVSMGLSADLLEERVAWDGMPAVEARLRKAAQDLEVAGLVERTDEGPKITTAGRTALKELPDSLDVGVLAERFPRYAAHRNELLQRRGA